MSAFSRIINELDGTVVACGAQRSPKKKKFEKLNSNVSIQKSWPNSPFKSEILTS